MKTGKKPTIKIKTRKDLGDLLMALAKEIFLARHNITGVYLPPSPFESLIVFALCHLSIRLHDEQPYYQHLLELEKMMMQADYRNKDEGELKKL